MKILSMHYEYLVREMNETLKLFGMKKKEVKSISDAFLVLSATNKRLDFKVYDLLYTYLDDSHIKTAIKKIFNLQ